MLSRPFFFGIDNCALINKGEKRTKLLTEGPEHLQTGVYGATSTTVSSTIPAASTSSLAELAELSIKVDFYADLFAEINFYVYFCSQKENNR